MKPGLQADAAIPPSMARFTHRQTARETAASSGQEGGETFLRTLLSEPGAAESEARAVAQGDSADNVDMPVVANGDDHVAVLERIERKMGNDASDSQSDKFSGNGEAGRLGEGTPLPDVSVRIAAATVKTDMPRATAILAEEEAVQPLRVRSAMLADRQPLPADDASLLPSMPMVPDADAPVAQEEVVVAVALAIGVQSEAQSLVVKSGRLAGGQPQAVWREDGRVRDPVAQGSAGGWQKRAAAAATLLPTDGMAAADDQQNSTLLREGGQVVQPRRRGGAGLVRQMLLKDGAPQGGAMQEMPVQVVQGSRQQFLPPLVAMSANGAEGGQGAWSGASRQVLQAIQDEGMAALLSSTGMRQPGAKVVQKLEIQLHPASLGTVNAQLSLSGGRLQIDIRVPDQRMVEHLREGIEQLERRIRAQDAGVAQAVVRVVVDAASATGISQQGVPAHGQGAAGGAGQGMQEFARQDGGGNTHSPRHDGGHADETATGRMEEGDIAAEAGKGAVYL